ncbi:MAG: hypothetical protein IJ153_01910 [Clostridia bacterium]|nr:hypothetical protein [Clostridia bacterium]
MKKLIALILTLTMLLTAAFATAEAFTLVAPTGAPALAVATLAVENPDNYNFITADTIGAEFAKNEADFIIAPINAGAKLFKAGKSTYQLAAVVTWGNLYFASQKADFTLESLNGAEVTLFGENTINASVVLKVLEAKGINPAAINYLAGAAETQAELLSNAEAIVVTADPAVTAAKIKNESVQTISLQELLKETMDMDGYTQAGLFVRAETRTAQPEEVKAYLASVQEAAEKAASDVAAVAEAAVALEILPNAKVANAAIPGCNIRFVPAAEAKEDIAKTVSIDPTQFGGQPEDSFYFIAE